MSYCLFPRGSLIEHRLNSMRYHIFFMVPHGIETCKKRQDSDLCVRCNLTRASSLPNVKTKEDTCTVLYSPGTFICNDSTTTDRLNSMRYLISFLLWCVMPSGRALKKSYIVLICLVFRGSCVVLHVSSPAGLRVLCVSESRTTSRSASTVHMSSILLSVHL
jgi:hypothetical protein